MNKDQTIIERFSKFASGTAYEDIPERVVEKIRLQIITSITSARFSLWHPETEKIYKAEKKLSNKKTSTIIANGEKLGAEQAAVVNAAYAISLDFDDYMLMGHMGYSAVLGSLAFLEESKGTVKELILCAAVANEVMGRLSLSCFFGPLNGQMWSYIHNLGAATAIGKAKGFDAKIMKNAMALSLYQPNFCLAPGFWTDGAKLLTASIPLKTGIWAALYAQQGLAGPENIIEGHLGFFHFFSFFPIPEFTGELGQAWLSDTLSYKRYPGTSYIGAPVDSALGALKKLGISSIKNPDQIKKITIHTTFLSYSLESISRAMGYKTLDPVAINFSVRFSVAYALLRGDLIPKHFQQHEINRFAKRILNLAEKIRVVHDWPMTYATLSTFPQLLRLLFSLKPRHMKKIMEHARALNKSDNSEGGLAKIILQMMRQTRLKYLTGLIKGVRKPISLAAIDLKNYPMLQSARATINLVNGKKETSEFAIPTGGSGQDINFRKKWVAKRFEDAFGKSSEQIFKVLENPEAKAADIIKCF